jgi:hypothetical protein
MVYLHEIALPQYKTVTGSLGFVSLGIGVVIGICVVAAVLYCIPTGEGGLLPAGGGPKGGGGLCSCGVVMQLCV